jgi:hypothetical protein
MELDNLYIAIEKQRNKLINMLNLDVPVPPDHLSEVCMKLAILNEMLGDHIPKLKGGQLDAEKAYYDAAKAMESSDTGASSTARLASKKERAEFMKADIKHSDLWKLISMAQSHIKALTVERSSVIN